MRWSGRGPTSWSPTGNSDLPPTLPPGGRPHAASGPRTIQARSRCIAGRTESSGWNAPGPAGTGPSTKSTASWIWWAPRSCCRRNRRREADRQPSCFARWRTIRRLLGTSCRIGRPGRDDRSARSLRRGECQRCAALRTARRTRPRLGRGRSHPVVAGHRCGRFRPGGRDALWLLTKGLVDRPGDESPLALCDRRGRRIRADCRSPGSARRTARAEPSWTLRHRPRGGYTGRPKWSLDAPHDERPWFQLCGPPGPGGVAFLI